MGCRFVRNFDLLSVQFHDVLDKDFDFFILLHLPGAEVRRVPLVLLQMDRVFVGPHNLHKMKVVVGARISIHDNEVIIQSHFEHPVKELSIRVLIKIFPAPFVLME